MILSCKSYRYWYQGLPKRCMKTFDFKGLSAPGPGLYATCILPPFSQFFFSVKQLNSQSNQILCGASVERQKESIYKRSRSQDQDGLYGKNLKNLFLQN